MKTIKLKPNGVGRYDDVSPFIVADNRLELKLALPAFNGEFYFIADNNGNKVKKLIPSDGNLIIDGLSAGELLAAVKHYLKGELIKEYKVEPLILKEADGKLSAEPEIIAVHREMGELKEAFAAEQSAAKEREDAFKEVITHQEERIKNLQGITAALLRFAYADYCKNVYLSGESIEDFCKEFGFSLTDEEKKILGGTNENED